MAARGGQKRFAHHRTSFLFVSFCLPFKADGPIGPAESGAQLNFGRGRGFRRESADSAEFARDISVAQSRPEKKQASCPFLEPKVVFLGPLGHLESARDPIQMVCVRRSYLFVCQVSRLLRVLASMIRT